MFTSAIKTSVKVLRMAFYFLHNNMTKITQSGSNKT